MLDKITVGLGVTLSDLVGQRGAPSSLLAATPMARHAEQTVWTDPGSGYVRRALSPAGFPSPIQLVDVHFPAGARVAFETGPRDTQVQQQVWVLDQPIVFFNPTNSTTRYAVVLVSDASTNSVRKF